eukprot:1320348-Alexandrium_andersonii.AAC.1
MTLVESVKQKRDHEMVCLAAPLASHASDGRAEAAVKSVHGVFRTMKVALGETVPGFLLHGKNPMLSWAIRHGAWLHTRYSVGRDGRSPYP